MSIFWMAMAASAMEPSERVTGPPPPPVIMVSPLPPPPNGANGPVPRGNPGDWVQTNDYPLRALRYEQEGIVGFRLTISPTGQVINCEITASSGTPELDEATCRLVSMRARFFPATNTKGNPVEGFYHNRVRWTIPEGIDAPMPGVFVISFVVETDGSQSDCRVLQSTGATSMRPPIGPTPCDERLIEPPYTDGSGKAVRKRVTITETTTVEDIKD